MSNLDARICPFCSFLITANEAYDMVRLSYPHCINQEQGIKPLVTYDYKLRRD